MPVQPKALREIIGNAGVLRLLARLVEHDRLPHALILEGPTGCGRRSLALALAAALLCPDQQAGDACGICAHCRQIAAGTHPDLAVLPGQREEPNGLPLEMVRQVAMDASSSPLLGVAKTIVIPEAERLRGATANALLKLLEEPPPRTTIVLTTSAAEGLLGTIRSRTQVYRLQALTQGEVAQVLERGGMSAREAASAAASGGGVGAGSQAQIPPAPIADLEQVLAGLDLSAIARVLAVLPNRLESQDDEDGPGETRTPAAVQRACLREWLLALNAHVRNGLRHPMPSVAGVALERLERIARSISDLRRNHTPRMVLEALALGR